MARSAGQIRGAGRLVSLRGPSRDGGAWKGRDEEVEGRKGRVNPLTGPVVPIEVVALDVDGTVLTPDHRVADSTRSAVRDARRGGTRVILASSRGPVALERIQQELGLRDEWFIGYQGALVARWVGEQVEVLGSTPLSHATAEAIEFRAVAAGLSVGRYIGPRWRVPRITHAIEREATITGEAPLVSTPEENAADDAPQKLLVIADGPNDPALNALAESLPSTVTATFSHRNYLEVTAAGVDKAHGLRRLVRHLGTPWAATAAVGDGLNDLALFAAVDRPIAMGQAEAAVKSAARWVTTSNTEDGVAVALTHLGLSNEPTHLIEHSAGPADSTA
jgi:Cof subfamily protein (haloacid dehalogenase superfamily)